MKKLYKIWVVPAILALGLNATAQNVVNNVLASSGGSGVLTNGNTLYFTVGETVIGTAVVGANQFTQGFHQKNTFTALSVAFTNFTASAKGNVHQLTWTTSSEINNAYFLIERSLNDGIFLPLKNVNTKATDGNSNNELAYTYANYNVENGINYYRLKQVDRDGKWQYSTIVKLESKGLDENLVLLSPNPVTDDANLHITSPVTKTAKAQVLDITGKVITEFKINSNTTPIVMKSLPAGTYLLRYTDGVTKQTIKFIKI